MGIVKMRKVASRLSFKEGKPQGYQLRQLVYAPIKEKDLIKYMANSANVPESTKPPKEKYKKIGENIKKHDLFIYFYLFLSIFLSAPTAQLLIPNSTEILIFLGIIWSPAFYTVTLQHQN